MIGKCFKALVSVICAFTGVQSTKKLRYDFEHGEATVFVVAGILMTIIFLAAIISFLLAALLGQLGLGVLIFDLLDITIEKGEKCFDLINFDGLLELLLILIISVGVVYFRLRKILLSTPGDLIFER